VEGHHLGTRGEENSARTRAGGAFSRLALPPGSYELVAELDGCAPSLALRVTVRAGEELDGIELALRAPAPTATNGER
jgi:hypothetical protein